MEGKKYRIIADILGSNYESGKEHLFSCPYCKDDSKKKMSVDIEKNVAKCWVCGSTTKDIRRLVRRFGNFAQLGEWDKLTNRTDINDFDNLFAEPINNEEIVKPIDLPEGFKSLCNGTTLLDNSPMTYLRKRGVTEQDILYWKIGYTSEGRYRGRIIIPSFNIDGDLNYYVARTFTNNDFKYLNPPASKDVIFNEIMIEWDEDLIITEGVFDAMEAGQNAVPLLGSTIRQNSKLFKKITQNDTPIFFALDPDARKKEDRMIKLFLTYGLEVYKIDTTGHEDVAEMGRKEFLQRKENAVPITGTDYLLESAPSFI